MVLIGAGYQRCGGGRRNWAQSRNFVTENATRERPKSSFERASWNTEGGEHWENRIT